MKLILLFIIFSFSLIAQISSNGSASVSVIVPLSIQSIDPNLDFGEIILTGTSFSQSIQPLNGAEFLVTGHPSRNITISFNPVVLTNIQWVSINGGTIGQIQFNPIVVKEDNSNVISGNSYALSSAIGAGELNLFLGGSINISSSQPKGDYIGTFTISVSY